MLAGPLAGIYDSTGHGRILFAFFAALAETERDSIREGTLEGLDAAAWQGRHGGRPTVITDDMLHTVLRRQAAGEKVEAIQQRSASFVQKTSETDNGAMRDFWYILWAIVLGAVPAGLCLFAAGFMICGISGCSGGGFGRSTSPGSTLILLGLAGLFAGGPLFLTGALKGRAALMISAVLLALVVSIGGGYSIGATWNGCPRGVPCSAE